MHVFILNCNTILKVTIKSEYLSEPLAPYRAKDKLSRDWKIYIMLVVSLLKGWDLLLAFSNALFILKIINCLFHRYEVKTLLAAPNIGHMIAVLGSWICIRLIFLKLSWTFPWFIYLILSLTSTIRHRMSRWKGSNKSLTWGKTFSTFWYIFITS